MEELDPNAGLFRFGVYEVNLRTRELRRQGVKIKLQEKPFQVLALLVEKSGHIVTREDFRQRMWPADTFVDFDANLNTALTKVRQALEEATENPRFVETLPRLGYRFIASVEALEEPAPAVEGAAPGVLRQATESPGGSPHRASRFLRPYAAGMVLLVVIGVSLAYYLPRYSPQGVSRAAAGKAMLVVLPFENQSGDPAQEYFSDGLTDEMITQIGGLNPGKLGVIARTSAMHYKRTKETVGQIARELGVEYALEGAVRRSHDRVHITAQLIQARDQTHLWTHTYESNSADILEVQRDVASHVAEALAVELLPGTRSAAARAASRNFEAYESYLEGRLYWNQRTADSLKRAEALFQRAIEKDPQSALAYAGLADTHLTIGHWLMAPPAVAFPKAREAAQKALALDDSLSSAHAALAGVIWEYEKDSVRAEAEFRRAIDLDPANATARQWYAQYLSALGRHDEAMAEMQRAHRLDPLSLMITADIGNLLYFARRFDEAIAASKKALESDPNFRPAYVFLGRSYVANGQYAEAIATRLKLLEMNGESEQNRAALRHAFDTGGIRAAWRWTLDDLKRREAREYVCPFEEALLESRLGNRDAAFALLEKSYAIGDSSLVWIKVFPALDPLRNDPRFLRLLERMHLGG
jgi:TolB-like protein/DNA-binding winged helix-turn-helix (wHTH) protein/Flp pilus assembly protein TadD